MNILALDLASITGWAYEVAGVRDSGSETFPVRAHEVRGWKFIRFSVWLYKWRDWNLDLVVCEKPTAFHSGQAASEIAFGFSTRVEEMCARQNLRFELIHNSTVKKFATGHGNAKKPAMIAAAQKIKPGVTDDNECDALWLLEYSLKNLSKEVEPSPGTSARIPYKCKSA